VMRDWEGCVLWQLVRAPDLLGLPSSICFTQYINAASVATAPDSKKKRVRRGTPMSEWADLRVVAGEGGAARAKGQRRRLL
jgi:hypothetical protein